MALEPWRLFVYGTLRQGFVVNEIGQRFLSRTTWLGSARVPGALYMIEWYPGLVEHEPGDVLGDVYALPHDPAFLAELDAYEMIGPDYPEPHEYSRVTRTVALNGQDTPVWVYAYQWAVDGRTRIPSGDFADRPS